MTAESKTSVAAHFVAYNFPSAADFGNLIDSYTDASDALEAVATAARTGSVGLVYVSGASAVSLYSATPTGLRIANAATTAAAVGLLGAGAVGSAIFFTSTTAAAQQQLAGGTAGRLIFEAITTASVNSQIQTVSAATQAEVEGASAETVYVTPERARDLPMMPKAWAFISGGSTIELKSSYNVASVVRKAAGQYNIVFSRALSTTRYGVLVTPINDGAARIGFQTSANSNTAAGTGLRVTDVGGTDTDPLGVTIAVFGDHP